MMRYWTCLVIMMIASWGAWSQVDRVYKSLDDVSDPMQVYHLQLHGKHLRHIPSQVYAMTNLHTLDLRGNKISTLSDSIVLLQHLQRLELSRNPLRQIPPALSMLKNLEELILWSTYVTDLPQELAVLDPTLKTLDLRSCPMTLDDQTAIEQLLPSVDKKWNYACNCSD